MIATLLIAAAYALPALLARKRKIGTGKAVLMSTVKTGVVVASDQHLVPVWKVADPHQKIKRHCLGARHREFSAVHEDICLRKVS